MKYLPGARDWSQTAAEGATGKDRPVGRAMAQSEALPQSGEQHVVRADDVTSPDDRKADLAALARRVALAGLFALTGRVALADLERAADAVERLAATLGSSLPEG